MLKYISILVGLIVVIGVVAFYQSKNNDSLLEAPAQNNQQSSQEKDNPPADAQPTATEESEDIKFKGDKLAHNYYTYHPEDYAAALNAKKPIFLYFYANWCPTCAEQEPMIVSIMNSFEKNPNLKNVVAFRVNFNDNATDKSEKDIAIEFGVQYQHTMFTLKKDGTISEKFLGQTREDILLNAISTISN